MLQELDLDPMSGLFHEEMAAVDAYRRAMAAYRGTGVAAKLREMFVNHREAAGLLRKHIRKEFPRTDACADAWNSVHDAPVDTTQTSVLQALKRGEECSRDIYRKTLADGDLQPGGRSLIAAILLPQTERHLVWLDRLLA